MEACSSSSRTAICYTRSLHTTTSPPIVDCRALVWPPTTSTSTLAADMDWQCCAITNMRQDCPVVSNVPPCLTSDHSVLSMLTDFDPTKLSVHPLHYPDCLALVCRVGDVSRAGVCCVHLVTLLLTVFTVTPAEVSWLVTRVQRVCGVHTLVLTCSLSIRSWPPLCDSRRACTPC